MKPSPPRELGRALRAAALIALALGGCALSEGNPWGVLDGVAVEAEVNTARDGETAVFTTNRNYRVRLEALVLDGVESATVHISAMGGTGALSFDPANPPPGYTNCHADHCHLVENPAIIVLYEDIEAELRATGGASTDFSLLVQTDRPTTLSPLAPTDPLAFVFCDGPCHLDRGQLSHLEIRVPTLHLRGTVEDLQTRNPRLPEGEEPLAFDLTFDEVTLRGNLEGTVERGQPLVLSIHATLTTGPSLFHDVPFEDLLPAADPDARANAVRTIADNLPLHHDISSTLRRSASLPHGVSP